MSGSTFMERAHTIQETYGYIPEHEISKLAEEFDMPRAKVYGVIRFYSMFYTEPTGKYIIRVCNSLSCHVNHSEDIVQTIKDYLGLEKGGTTKNKMFTLEVVECLGYCGEGPVMMVDDQVYKHLSKEKVFDILKNCV